MGYWHHIDGPNDTHFSSKAIPCFIDVREEDQRDLEGDGYWHAYVDANDAAINEARRRVEEYLSTGELRGVETGCVTDAEMRECAVALDYMFAADYKNEHRYFIYTSS